MRILVVEDDPILSDGLRAGLGLGAIRINFAGDSPLPSPVGSVPNRGYGQPTTLGEATAAVPFAIRLPAIPDLGEPDAVYLAPVPASGTVTLAWGERPGFPAGADGTGLVITEFAADIGPDTFEKMVDSGTTVQPVTVNGRPGLLLLIDGEVDAVVSMVMEDGLVTQLFVVRNPEKIAAALGGV